jgi:hypothetical protein
MTQDERNKLTSARFSSLGDSDLVQFELPTARAAPAHEIELLVRDHPRITLLLAVAFGFVLGRALR